MKKTNKGFTLIEIAVVITVIGVLATLGAVSMQNVLSKSADAERSSKITIISELLEKYYNKNGEYPSCTAMSQPSSTIAADTLIGINPDILSSPSDDTGTSSIIASCGDLPADTDKFAYVGDGTAACLTGAACTKYNLKYLSEELGSVVTVASRQGQGTTIPPVIQPPAGAIGGTGSDQGRSITKTSDGGYAITGLTSSYGVNGDAVIIKYNSDGNVSWAKTWGGSGSDQGLDIIQTSDGGYAVTGTTASFGTGGDMFLIKFDASGNVSWNKSWGHTSYERGNAVVQTSDGGYAVTGFATSVDPEYGAGNDDVFVVKYSATGVFSWERLWGDTGYNYGRGIIQTSDGGYAIIGCTQAATSGNYDVLLIKLDASGNLTWDKIWASTGTYEDTGNDIIQTSDGGYIVTGLVGASDMLLQKYTSAGAVSWTKSWGSATGNDEGQRLIQTSDNNVAVTGSTFRTGTSINDIFLAKFDMSGNLLWNLNWGGVNADAGFDLTQINDGKYIAIGTTSSYGAGGLDIALLKFNSTGTMDNCTSPSCQTTLSVVATPTGSLTNPTVSLNDPSYGSNGNPAATLSDISATSTIIIAP